MANYIDYLKEEGLFEKANEDKLGLAMAITDSYMGTCFPLSDDDETWLEENDLLAFFYDDMFLCDGCGWYCEMYEMQEDGNCTDCNE